MANCKPLAGSVRVMVGGYSGAVGVGMAGDAHRRVRSTKERGNTPRTTQNTIYLLNLQSFTFAEIYNTCVRTMLRCYNFLLSFTFALTCLVLV